MDQEALKQLLFDAIQRLENNGLIDYHFRECYLLKEDGGTRFFFDLISNFSTDVGKVVKQMGKTLNQPHVDLSEMNELCIKLKGSAACIGACRISAACSNLSHAIEKESKEGCLQVLNDIKHEYKNLQHRLSEILRVEQELISRYI
ncbi:histidine-containing phosphotransfer protein 2-like [Henckelia pumila]|uniref:histidine-containing phosphotransfer protein 2-like n=1 Tax=Henckelia pumila TaxID=405737 RepID=UPI003C6DCA14